MDDSNDRLVEEALDTDEHAVVGVAFIAIVWLSASIGFIAQVTDGATGVRGGIALAVLAALAVWMHQVHGVHRRRISPSATLVLLVGVDAVLVALLAIDQAYFVFLFGAYTLTFTLITDTRRAAAMSFAVTLIWVGGWIHHELPTGALATPFFVWATLLVITAAIDRVSAQSEERRRLLAEVHETRALLADAEHARGVLEERQRMAAEIHDTLAQGFTSIVLLSEASLAQATPADTGNDTSTIDLIADTARDNLRSARRLVDDLRPVELDGRSLIDTLEHLAVSHRQRSAEDVDVTVVGERRRLGSAVEVAVLRIAQESIHNATKYASASRIDIDVTFAEQGLEIEISDDGAGFELGGPPADVAGGHGGHGLDLMARRAADAGGTLSVFSRPGAGTTITANFPIEPTERPTP